MNKEEFKSIASIVLMVCCVFSIVYLVSLFPQYLAGFFFGFISYASFDAYLKKDL